MMKLVVLSCLMAAASAGVVAPIAPIAAISPFAYSAPFIWNDNNYRGPLSLAPGQPANILGSDGRPLDTLEVNQDRAAHIAKSLGFHVLKKRSAALIAPVSSVGVAGASLISPATPITYTAPWAGARLAPISYTAPLLHW
uniref:Cuticular protein 11 n=1 Tax=Antheraea yamamai TaxID=7121 RepID=G8FVQ4_ANTYA|nr:cuticular protein 11 [Antheraea yamamai]